MPTFQYPTFSTSNLVYSEHYSFINGRVRPKKQIVLDLTKEEQENYKVNIEEFVYNTFYWEYANFKNKQIAYQILLEIIPKLNTLHKPLELLIFDRFMNVIPVFLQLVMINNINAHAANNAQNLQLSSRKITQLCSTGINKLCLSDEELKVVAKSHFSKEVWFSANCEFYKQYLQPFGYLPLLV